MILNEIFFTPPETGNWLVNIIIWIVGICSSIGLGVVLFTVLLKLITLPFDLISRIQTRKNSLIMEQMRPELEKLQKQYVNDKQLYSQKMMALYKKNGYSMFGACLPTIVTLVIFIFAINAFTNYSKYQTNKDYYEMSVAYNRVIYSGLEADGEIVKFSEENGKLVFDNEKIINDEDGVITVGEGENAITYVIEKGVNNDVKYYAITTASSYVKYFADYDIREGNIVVSERENAYELKESVFIQESEKENSKIKNEYNNYLLLNYDKESGKGTSLEDYLNEEGTEGRTILTFIKAIGSNKSAEKYKDVNSSFLWVKNIWEVDSPLSHPVLEKWDSFVSSQGYVQREGYSHNMNQENFDLLTADLAEEKSEANGYFILVVLTAGIAFLSQFIMGKSQKASMELQTVDGQGAQTQKIMMWMMPIMMAFFSFMYTAAFSIYMILSQTFTIVFTLVTNFVIDKRFKKKYGGNNEKIRGRVYVPKEEEKPAEKKKDKKNKNVPEGPDFINGGKTHVRGRLK